MSVFVAAIVSWQKQKKILMIPMPSVEGWHLSAFLLTTSNLSITAQLDNICLTAELLKKAKAGKHVVLLKSLTVVNFYCPWQARLWSFVGQCWGRLWVSVALVFAVCPTPLALTAFGKGSLADWVFWIDGRARQGKKSLWLAVQLCQNWRWEKQANN